MKAYEILFIVDPTINDETRAGAMKRIDTAITDAIKRHMIVRRPDHEE